MKAISKAIIHKFSKLLRLSHFLLFLFYFSLFLLFAAPVKAQNLDSLFSLWNDPNQDDSIRVKSYKDYIWNGFLFSNPDTAFVMAKELHAYAREQNYEKAQSTGYSIQGLSWWIRGNYIKALTYYNRSLKIEEKLNNLQGISQSLNNIGLIYTNQGYYPKALEYYESALKIDEQLGDKQGIASSLNNIGNIYYNQGEFNKALDNYELSLKIKVQLGDQRSIARTLNNIGNIYTSQSEFTKALEFYNRSLKIDEQLEDKQGMASSLNNIGLLYYDRGDYSQALDYYKSSLKISEQLGEQSGIAASLVNIGNIYKIKGDYSKTLGYCLKGYKLAYDIDVLEEKKIACQCLYDTYKAMGNSNQALVYLEKLRVVEDSLQSQETTKKLKQMEFARVIYQDSIVKIEEARLVQEVHKAEVRKKNQTRNVWIGATLLFVLLAGGLFSRWRYVRKSKAVLQAEKDRSEKLLLNILPVEIAAELKEKGRAEARDFDMVSILFTDFKGFTEQSAILSAAELVHEINFCFEAFDAIMEKYGIEKIKTIGDAYMAAGGLPVQTDDSVKNTVLAALEMQTFITQRKAENDVVGKPAFEMRGGIHTGPVVAGIVGVKKFQYDIWGDTVNTAARMESSSEVGKVNISKSTYELLKDDPDFEFEHRGKISAKGKGEVDMYFVKFKNEK